MNYLKKIGKLLGTPPQSQPLDSTQVQNSAGGYVYKLEPFKQLERFLILGTEGGTFYAGEQELTFENIKILDECLKLSRHRTVMVIRYISLSGRAPSNDPALFALAYVMSKGEVQARQLAANVLTDVARTGTHLFHFVEYANSLRGWGRVLSDAVCEWYLSKSPDAVAEQVIKYRQRDGWSHRDVFRLAHPKFESAAKQATALWVCKGEVGPNMPAKLEGHIWLQAAKEGKSAAELIRQYGLTWESVPTELLNEVVVWEALLEQMPITAMIRNLGKMTSIGLLKPLSADTKMVCARLRDEALLKKGRVHPVTLLNALRTYQSGHGDKGKLTWTPVTQISSALEEAFYLAFQTVETSGLNYFLGFDISGSMSWHPIRGMSITPREASMVMGMVTARREPNHVLRAFHTQMVDIPITAHTSLNDAIEITNNLPWGGTDCAQPMLEATREKLVVDKFVVYTDNETWAGKVHPKQALDEYRQKMGRNASLIVVGMTSTGFSIADPKDPAMLDVVGFDSATPQLISTF